MNNYIGIDLGTTNSVICSYIGVETRIWKSPDQNDVTPSAIFIDGRGNKYIGTRAYNAAPQNPDNSGTLFKRHMGTNTKLKIGNSSFTAEQCSAEILKFLYGYLPEDIRDMQETGTVITVPAAFNQMQRDATLEAAKVAGIGTTGLLQEPVAAVMSVMRSGDVQGTFLIYDLGGGTLDVAIAEAMDGHVNLLAHGGIAMCGGRDFDRSLVDKLVRPWMMDNFNLPKDFASASQYRKLIRLATWATERAKIELSSRDNTAIVLSEDEIRMTDSNGEEIYLEVPLSRRDFNSLIEDRIKGTIEETRRTLTASALTPDYVEQIVFVGGPTNYKPLRDMVTSELGISDGTRVNPMTAVAEGASLFAESIDWSMENRQRKDSRGTITTGGVTFNYHARTPSNKARIMVDVSTNTPAGSEYQIDSLDTGWTSGRQRLESGSSVEVDLLNLGKNTFMVSASDSVGNSIALEKGWIVITRTAASVDAIPASHSMAVEVLERVGGFPIPEYIVRKGDPLPHKGRVVFKAGEALRAGDQRSLNFKLWEGEIEDTITDNRLIGVFKVSGSDFDFGEIASGDDLVCEYEILDSGVPVLEFTVSSIGATFNTRSSFYSRQEGQLDYSTAAALIIREGQETADRIDVLRERIKHPGLEQARAKAVAAASINPQEADVEKAQEARESVLESRKLLNDVRKVHRQEIRKSELDGITDLFSEFVKEYAQPSEITDFENLCKTAMNCAEHNDKQFEYYLEHLRGQNFSILWSQDWFVVEYFKYLVSAPELYADRGSFQELADAGLSALQHANIQNLRSVSLQLDDRRLDRGDGQHALTNIVRG